MGRTVQDRNDSEHTERMEEDGEGPGAREEAHKQNKKLELGSEGGEQVEEKDNLV